MHGNPIHKAMRNRTIARRALVNSYRTKPNSSGENIYKRALNRINRNVKNETRRNNIKRQLAYAANINTLVKVHGISKNHAHKIAKPIHNRYMEKLKNEMLNMNYNNIMKFKV